MKLKKIKIDEIKIASGRRKLRDITSLAESISKHGLINPITVNHKSQLLAGLHRLNACKSLGHKEISAHVINTSKQENRLIEIDENLQRNELTILERAEQLAERKSIYESFYPESKREKGGRHKKNEEMISVFSQKISNVVGLTDRSIRQDVQIAENIHPKAKEIIRDLPLANKKTELLKISRLSKMEQVSVIKQISNKNCSVVEVKRILEQENKIKKSKKKKSDDFEIVHGDCLVKMRKLASNSIDLIITSPPFNLGNKHHTGNKKHLAYDDNMNEDEYQSWQIEVLNECHRILKTSGSIFYHHKNRISAGLTITPYQWILKTKLLLKQEIVWINRSQNFDKQRFYPFSERVYWLVKNATTQLNNIIGASDVLSYQPEGTRGIHTRAFPLDLPSDIIKCFPKAKVVLDPFCGSGTVGVASL